MTDEKQHRDISDNKLTEILVEHTNWLQSRGTAGPQADLQNRKLQDMRIKDSWARLLKKGVVTSEEIHLEGAKLNGANLEGAELNGANLEGAELNGANLEGAELNGANLKGAKLNGAHLEGAKLNGANLEGATLVDAYLMNAQLNGAILNDAILPTAHLDNANLIGANLKAANLYKAHLQGAILVGTHFQKANVCYTHLKDASLVDAHLEGTHLIGANLEGAHLNGANLEGAHLTDANLKGAYLKGACLKRAKLLRAHLEGAVLTRANVSGADLRNIDIKGCYLYKIIYDNTEKYMGARISGCFGGEGFVRFANDQAWLEDYRSSREWFWQHAVAWLWKITSDYGRNLFRWTLVSFLLATFFACLYSPLPEYLNQCIPPDQVPSGMRWMNDHWPQLKYTADFLKDERVGFFSSLYFSIVTFTTLGFGDIVAANPITRFIVTVEVIIGYIMLGGLISIFANKFARRS